jgi:leader peptidase (prepilin peptidase) / N-methyltransferase
MLRTLGPQALSLLVLAPIVGSFIGVVVRRHPAGEAIGWSRSRCECCGTVLAPRDLVPLLSWAATLGRCRYCRQRLGWFYPAIEIAALLIALIAVAIDGTSRVWLDCLFGWWLLALAWIDLRHWVLPDLLTLPLIVIGLSAAALFDPESLLDRALGAVFGYLTLRGLAAIYRSLRQREGLGAGDAKLLSAIGAWVGLAALPQVILTAALGGLATAGVLRLSGMRLHATSALPFGPFLALPAWVIWLCGPVSLQ